MEQNSDNMAIFAALGTTPAEVQRTIPAGKLKGFTDINPMWRIKRLTEVFGPCGFGWYVENVRTWTKEGAGELACFVQVSLRVKVGGEWSMPIIGIGGNKVVNVNRNGAELNDEAYKSAYTDAISIACKNLGMCSDIYLNSKVKAKDNRTKYDEQADIAQAPTPEKRKPLIQDGNERWAKAISWCTENGKSAADLRQYFEISDTDMAKLQEILNFQNDLNK